jgi:hypothetical protein
MADNKNLPAGVSVIVWTYFCFGFSSGKMLEYFDDYPRTQFLLGLILIVMAVNHFQDRILKIAHAYISEDFAQLLRLGYPFYYMAGYRIARVL